MKKLIFILTLSVILVSSKAQPLKNGHIDLKDPAVIFANPPEAAKPGVLWMWMGSNLSKEGITHDLEALKAAGFGRTTMFSLADITIPWAANISKSPTHEIISWTEPWWKLVRHAAEESKRLGMDFGIFNGPSYESSGGKWITPEMSMQQLCFSETPVEGGKQISLNVPKPKVDLRAVQHYPIYNTENGSIEKPEIPERGTYYKDIALVVMPDEEIIQKNQVIDLTGKMSDDGKLVCELPAGKWILYRLGHTTMGTLIQPAQWEAVGFECDKMSIEAVSFHMDHVIGEIKKHLGDLIGTGITHVHFDSYEAGEPTWTPKFREEFRKRRGYDPLPFLVTMPPPGTKSTGFGFEGLSPFDNLPHRIIGSKEETEKFRADFKATVKDLYNEIYFTTIRNKLHEAKLEFLCEPYGGPWRQEEVLPKIDRVMTEFWTVEGKYTPFEVDPTIAAVRKSGQNLIEAEAFTGMPNESQWSETPEWLKPIGDAAYCAGINRFVLHRFPQQPFDERYKPGATMGQWGTHFDRTQTWWEPGKELFKYWHRCQALLQWGTIATPTENDFIATTNDSIIVKNIHRHQQKTDIYFVANTVRIAGTATCSFGISGKVPEVWDPVTVQMRDLPDYIIKDGQTIIPLKFDAAQSFFIVFRKDINISKVPKENKQSDNLPTLQPAYNISGELEIIAVPL